MAVEMWKTHALIQSLGTMAVLWCLSLASLQAREIHVISENGYVRTEDGRLVARVPRLTRFRVLQERGSLLQVTNDRVTGWIHRGQIHDGSVFPIEVFHGEARKQLVTARLLHREAAVLQDRGEVELADKRLREALGLVRETAEDGPATAMLLSDLGYVQSQREKDEEAIQLLQESLRILNASDPGHRIASEVHNNLSIVYSKLGHLDLSRQHLESALRIARATSPDPHVDVAVLVANLAFMESSGNLAEAQKLWNEYLEDATAIFGAESKEVAFGEHWAGSTCGQLRQWGEAKRLLERARSTRERELAKDAKELGESLSALGYVAFQQSDYKTAHGYYAKAIRILEKHDDTELLRIDAHLTLNAIFAKGKSLDVVSALSHMLSALKLMEKQYGGSPQLAVLRRQYDSASAVAAALLASSSASFDQPQMIVALKDTDIKSGRQVIARVRGGTRLWSFKTNRGWNLVKVPGQERKGYIRSNLVVGLKQNAIASAERLLDSAEFQFKDVEPSLDLLKRSQQLAKEGKTAESKRLMAQSLKLFQDTAFDDLENDDRKGAWASLSPDRLIAANWQTFEGNFSAARNSLERFLEIQVTELGDHPLVAATRVHLAELAAMMGDYSRAETEFREALRINESIVGKNELSTSIVRAMLGGHLQSMGRLDEALSLLDQTVKLETRMKRTGEIPMAIARQALSGIAVAEERYHDAVHHTRGALEIVRRVETGKDRRNEVSLLVALGRAERGARQQDVAQEHLQEAYALARRTLGDEHLWTLRAEIELAELLLYRGDREQAKRLAEQALRKAARFEVNEGIDSVAARHILGLVHFAEGQLQASIEELKRSRDGFHRYARSTLADIPSRHQFRLLQQLDGDRLSTVVGLARHLPRSPIDSIADGAFQVRDLSKRRVVEREPEALEACAEWVLNFKALGLETATKHLRLKRSLLTDYQKQKFEEWSRLRRQVSTYSLDSGDPKVRAQRIQERNDLLTRSQKIASQIGAEFVSAARGLDATKTVSVRDVQNVLEKESVLVEFLRIKPMDPRIDPLSVGEETEHYVAFSIPGQSGPVAFFDLGPADAIDRQIAQVRQEIAAAPQRIREHGEQEATGKLREATSRLAQQLSVIDWLRPKKIYLSPDSNLWLVPWAALPAYGGTEVEPEKFLIEEREIQLVVSGRGLASTPRDLATNRPVVFADPAFESGGEAIQDAIREFELDVNFESEPRLRSFPRKLGSVSRLPGTRLEAQSIVPRVGTYSSSKPELYLGAQSAESVFKQLRQPRTLVLSTHGFFLDADAGTDTDTALERCGLLMAGCNRPKENLRFTGEDGVLTGAEIVGTDLRGTELVVLSACETGLGDVQQGEGIAGLRQAFELAGARSVVATLWQIPDIETARLMASFWESLADGQPSSAALRWAQLARIKSRRQRNGAAHPFFWAGVSLSGN